MRVAYLGNDTELALDITRWFIACAAEGVRVDPFDMTLEEAANFDDVFACARVCEGLWNETSYVACLHVARRGRSLLAGADLVVVDGRQPDARERHEERLAMEVPFLCPSAVLCMHDGTQPLERDLAEAWARIQPVTGNVR